MYRFEGYDSFLATYINGDYSNLKYTQDLRIEEVGRISGRWFRDSCIWLIKNANRIDVLNLYHLGGGSFKHALAYKLFNPKGKVYLKLDGLPKPKQLKFWKNIEPRLLLSLSRFVSTELYKNSEILSRAWHHRIGTIPNPLNPAELQDFRPFRERSNVIMYSGRVEHEKGSHTLLEAFAEISTQIPGWSLRLVGHIKEQDIMDNFRAGHPELMERVIFTGEVSDREELSELYRDAKIFAFPSRHESFGIALTEAMSQGCFAVTTNIEASSILTENFRYALGSDVDDVDGLAKNLLYACTHESEIESLAREGREATLRRCDLKSICDTLASELHLDN